MELAVVGLLVPSYEQFVAATPCLRLQSLSLGLTSRLPAMRRSLWGKNSVERAQTFSLPTMHRLLSSSRCNNSVHRTKDVVSVCTNPEGIDVNELSALLAATGQNCERFPTGMHDGTIVPVDPDKLRCALRHSTIIVALHVEARETDVHHMNRIQLDDQPLLGWLNWLNYWMSPPTGKRTLVAFGRATSDHTLTASVYDLAVAPSRQRSGYGTRVLLRIVRDLTQRGIFDISATISPELRPFFEHCGFAPDTLKSVTMMYTRSPASTTKSLDVKKFGRRILLIPPSLAEDSISSPLLDSSSSSVLKFSRF